MALLTQQEILDVITAIISSGLDMTTSRGSLLQFINPHFAGSLQHIGAPGGQLLADLGRMNSVERLASGEVPLQAYLRNAALLLSGMNEQKVILAALDEVNRRATGAPRVDVPNIPETKERIIHADDLVTFTFMERGVRAAAAVMKLRVPRYENGVVRTNAAGTPLNYLGTGWLLTESLLITNHHVVNARNEGEADATEGDLRLQAQGTFIQLDFDADGVAGTELTAQTLEAWDKPLDYAVLRIPATGRSPLIRSPQAIQLGAEPIPVNIIQHPGGRSKRYGIRNNLVSAATAAELRYFTDTEGGSSGSPVLNDQWQVVALHRASAYVANVQFQGKTTAYVNVGTPLLAIIEDLRTRYPVLATTMGV